MNPVPPTATKATQTTEYTDKLLACRHLSALSVQSVVEIFVRREELAGGT